MEFSHWLPLFAICLLGAMSPGPSLAIVIGTTVQRGRAGGLRSAIAHGTGVALYGLMTVTGLAALIASIPGAFLVIQLVGACYLVWLGVNSLRSRGPAIPGKPEHKANGPAVRGFMVVFLNPKLAVFMLALFSQFLHPGISAAEKVTMVATVGITDASWYTLIVLLVSHPMFVARLQHYGATIDRVFGVTLVLLALSVAYRALAQA